MLRSGPPWIRKYRNDSTNQRSIARQLPKRGEIFFTALDRTIGREIQLTDMTIVAPIISTVRFPLNPVHVLLAADQRTGVSVISAALLNQIRAIDRTRLVKRLGAIDIETLERVDEVIKLSLGIVRL